MTRIIGTWLMMAAGICASAETISFTTIQYPGAISTRANAINDNGDIVGDYLDANNTRHAYILSGGGVFTPFDYQGNATNALDINNNGQVVGMYGNAPASIVFPYNGFLRAADGTFTATMLNVCFSGINDAGQIVGYTSGGITGFTRDAGGHFTYFASGGNYTFPSATNDSGVIVGSSGNPSFIRDASGNLTSFSISGSTVTDVKDINANGDLAGFYSTATSNFRGFVKLANGALEFIDYPGAAYTDLNGLNDRGQMAGSACDKNNICQGFVATELATAAVPEPGTAMLLAAALAGLVGYARLSRSA